MKIPRDPVGWHNVTVDEVACTFREEQPACSWLTVNMSNGDGAKTRGSWNLYTKEAIAWGIENPNPKTGNPRDYPKTNNINLRQIRDLLYAGGFTEDDMPDFHDGEDVTPEEARQLAEMCETFTNVTGPGTELCAYIERDSKGYGESKRFKKAT